MSGIITASAVRFNELSATHDGYTLLYKDNKVCRSDVKLSELVGDTSAYLTEEKANTLYQGKGDYLSASTSANFYPMTGNPSGFLTTHQSISAKEWNNCYDIVCANSGIWSSEYDWTTEINAASANAVNTTSAYVSANYYNIEEINDFLDEKYDTSSFAAVSGTFQEKLTFAGENNIITAINASAVGASGGASYEAGQGIKIDNNVISINTNGTANNANMAFAIGVGTIASGYASHAEGNITVANGSYSHAEGEDTSAIGNMSHAEGKATKANNVFSHSEGYYTLALGAGSHAEGIFASASGDYSHAEGFRTISNNYDHAEGGETSALESYSHAEGQNTIASGTAAHAEGQYTSAMQQAAHAEGMYTLAQATLSHAEGYYTIAGSEAMHAGGKFNKTSANAAFVIGNGTADDARSDAFIVYPDGSVSAAGKISANGVELGAGGGASYNAGQGIKIDNNTISIKSSGCSVTGTNAFAEGKGTSAHGNNSHAEGFSALAAGIQSHAEGCSNIASNSNSHAEGKYTRASGLDSHAEGQGTTAFGNDSHAEGISTLASGEGSHAEGFSTSAISTNSHTEGRQTIASGIYSHSEGYYTSAFGEASHAEGISTLAAEKYSHAEGEGTIANSRGMHAGGVWNKTSAGVLYVIGKGSSNLSRSDAFIINGDGSVSAAGNISANGVKLSDGDMKTSLLGFNDSNEISSYSGYALAGGGGGGATYNAGQGIKISNDNIISISSDGCSVTGEYAFAEGRNNSAHGYCSHAEGKGTLAKLDYAHAEGYGTIAKIGSHAEGYFTQANHEYTHAEGYYTTAAGYSTHAEGIYTKAEGSYSHAEGGNTNAVGYYSHVEGKGTIAGSDYMHAGGTYNKTSTGAYFVIGNGTSSERSDAFIIYTDGSVSAAGKISADGVELGAGGGGAGLQAVNKQVTMPTGSTVASVTLDNDKYNIIETITSAATELDINIPKSLTKIQEGAFEFSVEPNSVLVTVNAYMAGRQLPIKAPSAFDSTKLYQGTSLNNVLVIAEFDTYPITINNISTNDTSSSIVITVDGTMGSEPLPNNLEYTLALSIDGTVTNIDATGTTVTLTGTQYTNYSNADLVTADVIIDNKNYGTFTLKEVDPYNPLNLPANTIRVRYSSGTPTSTNPNITITRNYPYNEYDITYNNNNWQGLFSNNNMIATATKRYITDVLGANTTNVTAFGGDEAQGNAGCFEGCTALSSVQIFDTSNAVDFGRMFTICSKLNNVPLFDMSNASSTRYMFYNCTSMSSAPEFDISNVENLHGMFEQTKLTAIPEYDLSNAKNISNICNMCYSLKDVPLFKNTNSLVSSYNAFNSCNAVSGGISALYTQLATCQSLVNGNHNGTFRNCGTGTTQGAAELANIPSDWK